MDINVVRQLLQRREQTRDLLTETVGLFREYVEVHGYDLDAARSQAVQDTLDGMEATIYLHDNPLEDLP